MASNPNTICSHTSLTLREADDLYFRYICNGCREIDYGTCYRCKPQCDYQLRKECYTATPTASHPFFPHRPFTLFRSVPTGNACVACRLETKGWTYVHSSPLYGNIYMHSSCMKLSHSIEIDGKSMILKEKLVSVACNHYKSVTLGLDWGGWAYISRDQKLDYHFYCMRQMVFVQWTNWHAPQPNLLISSTGSGSGSGGQERGLKNRIFWKTAGVLFHLATGDVLGVIDVVQDFFY